nr:putative retrotransposon protein [Tanacetum cinerariifolium]
MKDNQVWCLVDLHPNGRTVRSKWIFKKNYNMDGNVHTFKARLVAKGFTQTYNIDYGETFSPVAEIRAIRILLAIPVFYDYEIWKMDVKIAFLNGHLNEDVYIPKGFVDPKHHSKKFKMDNTKRGSVPMPKKLDYRKSQGYVFVLNGGAVNWRSAKQSTIDESSTEAEYIATTEASIEVVWMRKFIDGLGDVMPSNKRPMEMLCDNTLVIEIANDPKIMKGSKHYQRKYHYIREVIQAGEIVFKKVHTYDNLADPFTKPMPYNKHFEHAMGIGVFSAISLM